ncbi:MAG: hypothetical protein A3I26_03640 [Candidatus Yanofskybacteria bacterium RIFCSPLOWO2_02_FULL_43_10]|nr:MAG: hypothetical protein A3C69_03705 [Candidatus Yanofskybacteria bacterium RIFCSPHIGHO2_02_FULL_43_12]OGN29593.1 MAG: hypothetical protein A3I26_03640 [Candidatus Yanofskybacteria bacterium RIFCSPLOWO2_02_FULL_43_10]
MPPETVNIVSGWHLPLTFPKGEGFILSGTEIPGSRASQTSFGSPPNREPSPRSALKEPSFLQRTMFPPAIEGIIREGSKRTDVPVSSPPWLDLENKDSRFCCFEVDKIEGTIAANSRPKLIDAISAGNGGADKEVPGLDPETTGHVMNETKAPC